MGMISTNESKSRDSGDAALRLCGLISVSILLQIGHCGEISSSGCGQRRDDEPLKDATVDRWWFEKFLQDRRLLPVKWAALRLGMTHRSFDELRRKLEQAGPQLVYHASPDLVGSSG
jgi:hypothetical protein